VSGGGCGERKEEKEYFSEVNATMNLKCEPCQAAAVRWGKKEKKRREYFSEVNSQCERCQAAAVKKERKE
jgi:hypothetical protein